MTIKWAPSSEFVSSSIPSWQISTAHAQPFRGARDLAFCLKVPLDSLLVWASSEGSGETARMRRLAWTFAARIGDKYQIRLTRSKCLVSNCGVFRSWSPVLWFAIGKIFNLTRCLLVSFLSFYCYFKLWCCKICFCIVILRSVCESFDLSPLQFQDLLLPQISRKAPSYSWWLGGFSFRSSTMDSPIWLFWPNIIIIF